MRADRGGAGTPPGTPGHPERDGAGQPPKGCPAPAPVSFVKCRRSCRAAIRPIAFRLDRLLGGTVSRIALKSLSPSDLTFFEWQFRNRNAGNQKSINLNADVFVDQLYPEIAVHAASRGDQIPVPLVLYGPGLAGAHRLTRKIIKGGSYKNWRLNGEFVRNPDDQADRYNALVRDDLALLRFHGKGAPETIDIFFVSSTVAEDRRLFAQLAPLIPGNKKSMVMLDEAKLTEAVDAAALLDEHPVRLLLRDSEEESALEEAVSGSEEGVVRIRAKRRRRPVLPSEWAATRRKIDAIGADGEGLVETYLSHLRAQGTIRGFNWISNTDATSPRDFELVEATGVTRSIDVKSTEGSFGRPVHIAASEVAEAIQGGRPYDIYRVYEVTPDGAKLRIASDIGSIAAEIQKGCADLPSGVRPDGFSVHPQTLKWSNEIWIERPDEPSDL